MAFNGRFILQFIRFAAMRGAKRDSLLALCGQAESTLAEADCRVTDEVYNAVVREALAQTDDPCLGLHLGESQNLSALGLVGQITQTSSTLKEALNYVCHFANLGCSKLPMSLVSKGAAYALTINPEPLWATTAPTVMRHTVVGNIAFVIRQFQSLTLNQYRPLAVHLSWSNPACTAAFAQVFRCPVKYQQSDIAILLHRSHVEAPIVTADYDLLRVLVDHATEKDAQLRKAVGFHVEVKQAIVQLLDPGLPSLPQVASQFNVSPRTLQRKLSAVNYTYQQLVDELRQELALTYLDRPDLSIGEVAYLLHYADVSAFSRAFKRWTGHTPQAHRSMR